MKAFISYSHKNEKFLERLHVHLAVLKREGKLDDWTDEKILAGGNLGTSISKNLSESHLFIALLSPDYLASEYCYNKEFEVALKMEEEGRLKIIPIIIEPCDWLSTPFKAFKAIPKDGKPISDWNNENTAFLDVVHEIREVINQFRVPQGKAQIITQKIPKQYKVTKDFDSIEKLEFMEKTLNDVRKELKENISEINGINIGVKARITFDDKNRFGGLIVNRNKIETECEFSIEQVSDRSANMNFIYNQNGSIQFKLNHEIVPFYLSNDDYNLFWTQSLNQAFGNLDQSNNALSSKQIASFIWDKLLSEIGVSY